MGHEESGSASFSRYCVRACFTISSIVAGSSPPCRSNGSAWRLYGCTWHHHSLRKLPRQQVAPGGMKCRTWCCSTSKRHFLGYFFHFKSASNGMGSPLFRFFSSLTIFWFHAKYSFTIACMSSSSVIAAF